MPQQERPQDQLAQAQLLRHQHPYLPGGNAQHPPGRARHRAQEYVLAGEQADLAQELRRAIRRDNRLARLTVPFDDPDPTCQHRDQVITHIPVGKQHIAGGNVVLTAIPAQYLKLRRVQDRAAPSLGLLRAPRPLRLTCPRLVATMRHARHIGAPILTGLGVGIDYVAPFYRALPGIAAAGAAKRIAASRVSAPADSRGCTWALATMTAARMREILGRTQASAREGRWQAAKPASRMPRGDIRTMI